MTSFIYLKSHNKTWFINGCSEAGRAERLEKGDEILNMDDLGRFYKKKTDLIYTFEKNFFVVDSHCCANFCYIAKWLLYIYICIFHILFYYCLSQDIEYSSQCHVVQEPVILKKVFSALMCMWVRWNLVQKCRFQSPQNTLGDSIASDPWIVRTPHLTISSLETGYAAVAPARRSVSDTLQAIKYLYNEEMKGER